MFAPYPPVGFNTHQMLSSEVLQDCGCLNLPFISHIASHHWESERGCSVKSRHAHFVCLHTGSSQKWVRLCNTTCFSAIVSWFQHPKHPSWPQAVTGHKDPRLSPAPFSELRAGSKLHLTWLVFPEACCLLRWPVPPDWPPLWASFFLEEGERRKRDCYGSATATSTQGYPIKASVMTLDTTSPSQSLFLVVLFLIPTPKPSPFSSPFPLYATSWIQLVAFISGLLLHMLYESRERASGRQRTRVGNSSGAACTQQSPGKGFPLYQPCFSFSTPCCFSPAPGPFVLKGKWEEGKWLEPYCRNLSWRATGIQDSELPWCSFRGGNCSFAAWGFLLCCCGSEEAVLTTSQRTWDICWCAACQRNPEQGHSPSCRTVVHQLQTGSETHCRHPAEGQWLGYPVLLVLLIQFLETWHFLPEKYWSIPNASQESLGVGKRKGCAVAAT